MGFLNIKLNVSVCLPSPRLCSVRHSREEEKTETTGVRPDCSASALFVAIEENMADMAILLLAAGCDASPQHTPLCVRFLICHKEELLFGVKVLITVKTKATSLNEEYEQ